MKPDIIYRPPPRLANGGKPSPANAASAKTPVTAKSVTPASTKRLRTPAAQVTAIPTSALGAASGTSATGSGGKRKLNLLLKELECSDDPRTVIATMIPAELIVLALYLWAEKKLKRASKAKAQKAWRDKQAGK